MRLPFLTAEAQRKSTVRFEVASAIGRVRLMVTYIKECVSLNREYVEITVYFTKLA